MADFDTGEVAPGSEIEAMMSELRQLQVGRKRMEHRLPQTLLQASRPGAENSSDEACATLNVGLAVRPDQAEDSETSIAPVVTEEDKVEEAQSSCPRAHKLLLISGGCQAHPAQWTSCCARRAEFWQIFSGERPRGHQGGVTKVLA